MSKLRMKAVKQLNEKDLKSRIIEMRTELSKLEVENLRRSKAHHAREEK